MTFIVSHQPPVSADPAERAFNDPSFGQDDETVQVRAFDDLQRPRPGTPDHVAHLRPRVATVADDALDEREPPSRLAQQRLRAIAILNVGGVDVDTQQEAERVDKDMSLAPEDFLARVVAGRIKRAPPFSAPLALWASTIAVVGLASRPAASRLWT